jgi:ribosomal protein S18 acetylase RimI-like enzyme
MAASVGFRPVREDDLEFLYRVYANTRYEELSVTPWTDAEKEAFLQMQFNAQHRHYQQHFPDAAYSVIMLGEEPIGRLYLDHRDDEIRIVDIALLPEYRGNGIGGELIQDLLDESAETGRPVRIHVEQNNPALRLYQRLGFKRVGETGVYLLLEWTPESLNK